MLLLAFPGVTFLGLGHTEISKLTVAEIQKTYVGQKTVKEALDDTPRQAQKIYDEPASNGAKKKQYILVTESNKKEGYICSIVKR